jgi:hypothetical protein
VEQRKSSWLKPVVKIIKSKAAIVAFLLYLLSEIAFLAWDKPEQLNYQYFITLSIISLLGTLTGSTLFRCVFLLQSAWLFLAAFDSYLFQFHNITTLIYSAHNYTMSIINILILGIIIGGDNGGNTNKRTRRGHYRRGFYALQAKN